MRKGTSFREKDYYISKKGGSLYCCFTSDIATSPYLEKRTYRLLAKKILSYFYFSCRIHVDLRVCMHLSLFEK